MTRRRRRKSTTKPVAPAPRSGLPMHWVLIGLTVLLAGTFFLLGRYMEIGSPGPFDSAAYVYSAQHILEGAQLGVEEVTSARPATLLINVIGVSLFGYSETGPKLLQGLLQGLALVMMFLALRKLFGGPAACVGVTVAAFCLSAPLIAKYGNVKEQYMIALMVIAVSALILYELGGRWGWALLCSAAAINVYYFKETGVSVVIAIGVHLVVDMALRRRTWRQFRDELLLLLAGGVMGLVPLGVFYRWLGQWDLFRSSLPIVLSIGVLQFVCLVALLVWLIVYLVRRRRVLIGHLRTVRPMIWWLAVAVAGVTLIVLVGFSLYFARTGDLASYIWDIPGVNVIPQSWSRLTTALDGVRRVLSSPHQYWRLSRAAVDLSQQAPKVLRYYAALKLPIVLAGASLLVYVARRLAGGKRRPPERPDQYVPLLAVWWILDMALLWISPRSYEQYYLPLTASGGMLGGYIVWFLASRTAKAASKPPWVLIDAAGLLTVLILAWPLFFGMRTSPSTGATWKEPRYGYVQRIHEVQGRQGTTYPWQAVGDYIRRNSTEQDSIYVWGWVPGIYVRAQRFSCVPQAFTSDMHVTPPQMLSNQVRAIVAALEEDTPSFIVDSRKQHYPWDRPALELWPITDNGPLSTNPATVEAYDKAYKKMLAEVIAADRVDRYAPLTVWDHEQPWAKAMPDEAQRYEALAPLRAFIRAHYRLVKPFGTHVLFERTSTPTAEPDR